MNLSKLFDAQKKLRERINYNGEDRFEKLILSLLVEIGECANEWRGFKFWSQDQEPRTTAKCRNCGGKGKGYFSGIEYTGRKEKCIRCDGTGVNDTESPLLEEYVDGLHFVLEIGLEVGIDNHIPRELISFYPKVRAEDFKGIYWLVSGLKLDMLLLDKDKTEYEVLMNNYLLLGKKLGFTWEQIEQAYFDKNQINHERQNNGY